MKEMMDRSRHGGPYDRGRADSWYGRTPVPHYFPNGTYMQPKVTYKEMSKVEIEEYWAGYDDNESEPDMRKEW